MNVQSSAQGKELRIDFAPLVDLGFLLITFFIFTTHLQQPQAMQLHVPEDGPPTNAPLSSTITLTLKEQGMIFFREGNEMRILASGNINLYRNHELRTLLLNKRNRLLQENGTDKHFTVLIEPTSATHYKELVDVFDEMTICGIKKFVLMNTMP
jgi:biopolymer transport protein ExbD